MKSCTCVGCLLVIVSFSLLVFLIAPLIYDIELKLEPDSTSGKENLVEIVGTNHSFLMFHHQDSKPSKTLDNSWNLLRNYVETDYNDINIIKFDCSVFGPICREMEIDVFPTLAWIQNGTIIQFYEGEHDIESLKTFVFGMDQAIKSLSQTTKKLSELTSTRKATTLSSRSIQETTTPKIEKAEKTVEVPHDEEVTNETLKHIENSTVISVRSLPQISDSSNVIEASAENFTESLNSEGFTLVLMYAPWCKYCKEIKKPFAEVASKYSGNASIRIVQMDCNKKSNRERCNKEHCQGFPTVNMYKDGLVVCKDYSGYTFEQLYDLVGSFLNDDMAGFKIREAARVKVMRAEKWRAKKAAEAEAASKATEALKGAEASKAAQTTEAA